MRQPQPDEGQPAGRATAPGQPEPVEPPPAGGSDDRDRTAPRVETSPTSGAADSGTPVDPTTGPDRPVGAGADPDRPPPGTDPEPDRAPDPTAPTDAAGRDDDTDTPTRRTEPAAQPDDGTDVPTRPATVDAEPARTGPAANAGSAPPDGPAGADAADPSPVTGAAGPAPEPTRVAAPRWTGSAAVPPPQNRRRRRWLGGGDEPAAPAGPPASATPGPDRPSTGPRRPDPTLRMPTVESDDAEMPTPVDPWAGTADDPWLASPAYPPAGGQPLHPSTGHTAAAAHPTRVEPAAPVSPPPHPVSPPPHPVSPPPHPVSPPRQLSPTRVFPSPAGPPPPAPTPHPPGAPSVPRPRQTPEPTPRRKPARPKAAPPPPPPAPVAPPQPSRRKRRKSTAPPQATPPGWKPPQGYVPIPVRRRRRWPRVMLVLTLLSVFCCCGVPGYYLWPVWDQYPAQPADPLPQQVRDLRLQDDGDGERAVGDLKADLRARNWLAEGTFAAVYRDGSGKRVTIFGTTGFRLNPESDVTKEQDELREQYNLATAEPVKTDVRGEYRSCTTGKEDGESVVLCTTADHGSLVTGLFTRRSLDESAELLAAMRTEIVLRE
ncbi:hypothetical protein [Plantactinospora sonchi]|uniref:Uncharacterized protein n=1 Tax=Plantactinospora sonchi TaxID=1544735 RepID=A0ABU7S3X3_9ACTN